MSHLILLSISTISLDAPSSFSDASTLENEDTFLSLPKVHHLIITCTTFSCEVFQLESVTCNIYFWARVKFSRINAKNCPFCVICQILARDVEGFQKKNGFSWLLSAKLTISIEPWSDHSLHMSVTHSLTHNLLESMSGPC